ncbi:DUF3987 domain-containing protein [Endozoicomonas acroporae]|uniref:DUF3987 domain-containing protein n=1 Tax=Endozoicomonas acroporae TaxID=1701104 RepID=UPI000C773C7C|nr:DUF3987 domain-containing protein [Endozoicomonas acroporae]
MENRPINRTTIHSDMDKIDASSTSPVTQIYNALKPPHPPISTSTEKREEHNELYNINPPPKTPEGAFPPDLQSAVNVACHHTEAHPMAVALHLITYFAAHVGQQRHVMIGNEKHPLIFYGLLVGDTGRVKGTAESQARYIDQLGTKILKEKFGYQPPRTLSGLSSGEGLIQSIQDPDNDNEREGVQDKRLMITESEYANVLAQGQRGGNTLSMVLRDAYDGKMLANMTVNPRMATHPHINIIGHITPEELSGHKSFLTQAQNGALNRNLIFSAKREKPIPNPRRYSSQEAEALSKWYAEVIIKARDQRPIDNAFNDEGKEITMSEEGLKIIEAEYIQRESDLDSMPRILSYLASRHRVFIWRLSAIFALMDYSDVITAEHVSQAYKCMDYSLDSLRYLLKTARQEAQQEEAASLAERILYAITFINNGSGCTLTDIHKHFKNKLKSSDMEKAICTLLESAPPKIEEVVNHSKNKRGRRAKIFRPTSTKKTN